MADRTEVATAVSLFETKQPGAEGMAPRELILDLTDQLQCTYEHARELIFAAVDLGLLALNSGYAIISPDESKIAPDFHREK